MTPTRPISTRPKVAGSGCATVALVLFGLVFLVVGLGSGWFAGGKPILHVLHARGWSPSRCQILTNEVVGSGSGDTTRVAVTYRYAVGGREQRAARYDFSTGSDNISNQAKRDFVRDNPPGKEVDCFVNPADPSDAVLDRSMKWNYGFGFLFGTIFGLPGLFLVGAAVYMFRNTVREKSTGLPSLGSVEGVGLAVTGALAGEPPHKFSTATSFAPAAGHSSTPGSDSIGTFRELSASDMGPLVLAPSASPIVKLLVLLFVFFFWDGIVAIATSSVWGPQANGGLFPKLFLLPFQIIGLLIAWGVVYQVMALFNPRPTLTLGRGRVRLGESVALQWRIRSGASRIGTLRIVLTGREEATYTRGTTTHTDTNEFHRSVIVEASDPGRIETGMTTMNVPANGMHSFKADHNKIVWTLTVTGDIRLWPDMDESFDITVTP